MLQNWQKIMHRGVSLAIILVLLVTMVPAVFAQDGTLFTVNVDGLLVYEQPDAASKLIAVMSLGSAITTFPDDVQNGFTRVRLPDNREGWSQLGVAGAPEGAPTTGDGSGGGASEGPTGVVVQAQANVRIRTEPSLNGVRVGNIAWGEVADLLATDPSGDWYKINYQGLVGWAASAWFITVSGNLAGVGSEGIGGGGVAIPSGTIVQAQGNVRIRDAASLNGARIGFVPWGGIASLLGYDSTGDWININYNGLVGWSAAEWWYIVSGDVASVARGQGGAVFVGSGYGDLILYNGPSVNAVAIQVVPNGTPFNIIEGGRADGFTHIQLADGTSGFVMLPEGQGGGVPVTSSSGSTGGTTTVVITGSPTGVVVMSLGNLRIRNAANIAGDRVGGLIWGEQAAAYAISADGEWILVQTADGVQGWVASAWLEVVAGSISALPPQ